MRANPPPRAVAIGASAGALKALSALLPALPADYPLALLVVVHIPARRPSGLCDLFAESCRIAVCEAEDKQPIAPATAYFAPPDYHMLVDRKRLGARSEPEASVAWEGPAIALSVDAPELYSRPSIDVLFESAATCYGSGLIAAVLSGSSADGSRGLAAVRAAGGRALVQDPTTAEWPFMPQAARDACPSAEVLGLDGIRERLLALGGAAWPSR